MGLFWLLSSGPSNDPSRRVFPNFWSVCPSPTVCTAQHGCILRPGIVLVVTDAISPENGGLIAALSELADLRCVSTIVNVCLFDISRWSVLLSLPCIRMPCPYRILLWLRPLHLLCALWLPLSLLSLLFGERLRLLLVLDRYCITVPLWGPLM